MPGSLAEKLISNHLVGGTMKPKGEIAIKIDQTLTQDATGTLVMLSLEALGLERTRAEISAQYVDHNLLQEDARNSEDHDFLQSACRRFGVWFSRPGNGVSHPVHMQRFGVPGKTLLGSDSHTCAAGGLGMLAMGAGGLDVAMAMAGEPFVTKMPEIWGVRLTGQLGPWVSAKDVILEMLRRHDVDGGLGRIVEYYGPGVKTLSAMDRHVIANMGAELGATTSLFPSDDETLRFLVSEGRGDAFVPLEADADATYSLDDEIALDELEPLVALPTSPGNVVPVREVAGRPIAQAYIGSSANPGHRDFAAAAAMVEGRTIASGVSFDINPTSRQLLVQLARDGNLEHLVQAGARVHQTGCNGCIGMGQAPATGRNSLRTVPRNFPGRSGTKEDAVYLCSPETATASAVTGKITDPRQFAADHQLRLRGYLAPRRGLMAPELLDAPAEVGGVSGEELERRFPLVKGENISSLPRLDPLPDQLEVLLTLQVGDDVSTDEILPAGAKVLPFRSNLEKISQFCFTNLDANYASRARETRESGGHAILAGKNYGQGSSREHAALAPRFLGLRIVLAESFARIHENNLINFGVLPLRVARQSARHLLPGQWIRLTGLSELLSSEAREARIHTATGDLPVEVALSARERSILRAGGLVNWWKRKAAA